MSLLNDPPRDLLPQATDPGRIFEEIPNENCRKILPALTVAIAAGCAQIARSISENFVFKEDSWAASQKHTNMQAVVEADEEYPTIRTRSLEVYAGVGPSPVAVRCC